MLQLIISALHKENIAVWRIKKTESCRSELYFIKKDLDIPRFAKINEYQVYIYRDFEENGTKYRGLTICYVEEGQTEEQISAKLRDAYFAAQYVRNPYYDLPSPCNAEPKASSSDHSGKNLTEIANAFADAAFAVPTDENAFINSLEIFVSRSYVTLLSSDGLNVSYEDNQVSGEFVTQCISPVDVEQFRQFSYDRFDTQALKNLIASAIRDVRLRSNAVNMPKSGKCSILLTGENMKEFFKYYSMRGNASVIFPGYSTWKKGDCIQKSGTGEKLNLELIATKPYSDDGIPMSDLLFIEDGVLKNIWGGTRFMRYMNEEPKGNFTKIRVNNGTIPFEKMKTDGILETVSFSDFQADFFTGNFGGEMRLALFHNEGKAIPLSGGSVNAKLSDCENQLIFSTERYEDSEYCGPYAVLIPNVAIAGK